MQIKKRKIEPLRPGPETKRSVEAHLAWAAGTERLAHHDPLYHVTEDFQQTFDRIGQTRAREAAGFSEKPAREEPQREAWKEAPHGSPERDPQKTLLIRFSELAFQRGVMSAAVLNGTGKLMLVSCLRRTADEAGAEHAQQSLTGICPQGIPGHGQDQLVFRRGLANGALGLVVDTLRDARSVVASMEAVARGAEYAAQADRAAMFKLYPFLDDSRDAALEATYREKLASCADAREKPVLQNAVVQTAALRAKKAQMKNELINKLRFLSDRAEQTLLELERPDAADELMAAAFGNEPTDLPENPEEGGDDGAANREKNSAAQANGTGNGPRREDTKARSARKPGRIGADGNLPRSRDLGTASGGTTSGALPRHRQRGAAGASHSPADGSGAGGAAHTDRSLPDDADGGF